MELDELARERQSEPGALGLLPVARLLELLEDRFELLGSDPGAGVDDGDLHVSVSGAGRDVDPAVGRGELDGVGEEVEDDLADAALVGRDRDLVGGGAEAELDAAAAGAL